MSAASIQDKAADVLIDADSTTTSREDGRPGFGGGGGRGGGGISTTVPIPNRLDNLTVPVVPDGGEKQVDDTTPPPPPAGTAVTGCSPANGPELKIMVEGEACLSHAWQME